MMRSNYHYFLFCYLHSTSCITYWPSWSLKAAQWPKKNHKDGSLYPTVAKNKFPWNRGALMEPLKLTEPHYMFCGTPVEEHCPTIKTQLLLLSNTVVLLAFLVRKARLVFLDLIFSILICFNQVIQKSDCYWVLARVFTAPVLNKPEIARKSLCQLATKELYPKRQRKG